MLLSTLRGVRRNGWNAPLTQEFVLRSRALGIPSYRQMIPVLAAELRRSRRYERPLSVLVLNHGKMTSGDPRGEDESALHSSNLVFFLLGSLLRDTMRESDIITYAAEDHLYALFLPESDEAGARQAVDRIRRFFFDRAKVHLRVGLAEFPRDGLIVQDVFDRARNAWQHSPLMNDLFLQPKEANRA